MDDEHIPTAPMDVPGAPLQQPRQARPRRPFPKRFVIILVSLVLLTGIGYGGWKLYDNKSQSTNNTKATKPGDTNVAQTINEPSDVPAASLTKVFKSSAPALELTHPDSWTVSQRDKDVRMESPEFSYLTMQGSKVKGNFRIYIRQGSRPVDSKYIGRGVAVGPSEKIMYTSPALGQRTETLLTNFGLDTSDNFGFFLIAGNYQLKKDDTLGPDYGKEPETFIVAGGFTSKDLTEDLATHPVPLDGYAQTNAYKQAVDIVKSLKLL